MSAPPRMVVIGATGFTGRLVARQLAAGSAPFLLTGRSAERLRRAAREAGGAAVELVDVTRRETIERVLRAGDVVINCAGPFTALGEPVVEACVRAGAHYLDTTGEQLFMKRVQDRFGRAAQRAGIVVANAMAFEFALGDCAAALAARDLATPLRSVVMTYAWGGGTAASRGTRRSVLQVVRDGGFAYRDGRWTPRRTGSARTMLELPGGRRRAAVWFPAGEILTVPRHLEVQEVTAWIVTGRGTAAVVPLLAPALPHLARFVAPVASRLLRWAPEGPAPAARERSRFLIRAEAAGADGARQGMTVQGRDPYGLTARIAVHCAAQILLETRPATGVVAPAQVVHPPAFRRWAEVWGTTWHETRVDSQ